MARRRAVDTATGDMPAPFLDPAADEWHDPELFARFATALDLDVPEPDRTMPAPCGRRRLALVTAWALGNGYRSIKWPNRIDHERITEAGIGWLRNYGKCPHRQTPPVRKPRRRRASPDSA